MSMPTLTARYQMVPGIPDSDEGTACSVTKQS